MAGILAAGTAPAIVHAQQQIRWRLASSFPKSLETVFGASEAFSKYVSEATGGKFVISVHPAGELVPAFGVVDAVQQGTIECAHTAPYYFFGKDETFAFDCTIPFGMTSRAMSAWMYAGNGMKLLREFYAQFNIVNFPCGNSGAQMGGWYRKEIKSVKDFEGLKFRVGGFGGRVLAKLGAVPQNIPAGEIYQALEKGTIDAAEWIGPYDDLKLGLHKVAQHYYFPAWWEGSTQFSIYINDKQWNGLPAEYKAIIEQAGVKVLADAWLAGAFGSKDKCIRKPEDAAGLKVRSAGATFAQMWAGAGASVISIASNEVYNALQQGVIQATDTSTGSFVSFRLYEQLKCVTAPGDHALWFMYEPVLISLKSWNRLNDAQQKALLAASKKAEDYFEGESKKLDDKFVEVFKANKVEVVTMNEAEFDAWRAVAQKTSYKVFAEKVPGGKELIEKALSVK